MGKVRKLVGILVMILIAMCIGFSIYRIPEKRLLEQLDLGNKYLDNQDYEEAVIAFTKAIEIAPMSVEAYMGAAEAYIGMGNLEQAKDILEQGLEYISDVGLEGKLKEVQEKIERMEKEKREAEEKAKREAEEKKKIEEALKPLYEKLAAHEADESIAEYCVQNNLGEIDGSYSATGDTENGIVLDMYHIVAENGEEVLCFFYGEKTEGSYETTGSWFVIDSNDNDEGIATFSKYEGEWKNGMPNGQGTKIDLFEAFYELGEETIGKGFDKGILTGKFMDGYAVGTVQQIENMDIYDEVPQWWCSRSEIRYIAKDKKIMAGTYKDKWYGDDGTSTDWYAGTYMDGECVDYILGPWVTE